MKKLDALTAFTWAFSGKAQTEKDYQIACESLIEQFGEEVTGITLYRGGPETQLISFWTTDLEVAQEFGEVTKINYSGLAVYSSELWERVRELGLKSKVSKADISLAIEYSRTEVSFLINRS